MEGISSMNILHFGCAYKPYRGGSRVRLEKLVTNFDKEKVKLSLITHTLSDNLDDDTPFFSVLRMANANSILPSIKIFRFLRAQQPDVVILHNSRVLLAWFLLYRLFFQNTGVICELHSVRETTRLKRFINGLLYRSCDRLVVLSSAAGDWVRRHYKIKNATTIVNGTDLASASSGAAKSDYNPASVHYVYAGSFHEWQGVVVLAKAARQLGKEYWKKNRLTLIGGGPALSQVREILGSELLSLDSVNLMGWADSETVRNIQLEADFLLAPRPSTVATETVVPLKVVDSVTLGRPLLASSVGGIMEFLGGSGGDLAVSLVKPNDVSDLVRCFSQPPDAIRYYEIISNLDALRREMPTWAQSSLAYENLLRDVALDILEIDK